MTGKKEYWQMPAEPEDQKDLDPELFEELNAHDDYFDDGDPWKPTGEKKKSFFRVVGLVTVAVFFLISLGSWTELISLPSLDFLAESWNLSQNQDVRTYRQAVTAVKADGRRGTGFNIDPNGLIVTNYHVVKEAKEASISFEHGAIYQGKEIIAFPEVDLALVNIGGEKLPALALSKEQALAGDKVIVIGNPLGFPRVAAQGEVLGNVLLKGWTKPVLMIKGPIYHGSSGSPVLNEKGKVVGVVFATLIRSEKADAEENIGLAVPIAYLNQYLNR
ncbi:MAG: S1C family serine protease [Bacillota bacterium]